MTRDDDECVWCGHTRWDHSANGACCAEDWRTRITCECDEGEYAVPVHPDQGELFGDAA